MSINGWILRDKVCTFILRPMLPFTVIIGGIDISHRQKWSGTYFITNTIGIFISVTMQMIFLYKSPGLQSVYFDTMDRRAYLLEFYLNQWSMLCGSVFDALLSEAGGVSHLGFCGFHNAMLSWYHLGPNYRFMVGHRRTFNADVHHRCSDHCRCFSNQYWLHREYFRAYLVMKPMICFVTYISMFLSRTGVPYEEKNSLLHTCLPFRKYKYTKIPSIVMKQWSDNRNMIT